MQNGGPSDCDLVDTIARRRWRLGLGPGLASVCVAAFQ